VAQLVQEIYQTDVLITLLGVLDRIEFEVIMCGCDV
jgi:hypothetical protein